MRTVSYIPYTRDLSHPGDRRRVKIWSDDFGIPLGIHSYSPDNLLILSEAAKLRKFAIHHSGPVVIDLIDGYLSSSPPFFQDFGRNIIRATIGKSSLYSITFSNELINAISSASAVVVSSPEQAKDVRKFNRNVHCILDDHSELIPLESEVNRIKSDTFTIIWEGLGFTLKHLLEISGDLEKFMLLKQAKLIIVTNSSFKKYSSRFKQIDVKSILKEKFRKTWDSIEMVEWSVSSLKNSSRLADIAIIPINMNDDFAVSKPENKLLSFWTLGVPTICSPTPAYRRVLSSVNQEKFLLKETGWYETLLEYYNSVTTQNNSFQCSQKTISHYLNTVHTREILSKKWDEVLRPFL